MSKPRFIAFVALLFGCCACTSNLPYQEVGGTMLGTSLSLIAQTETPSGELYAACMALDAEAKRSMSIFDPQSRLSRLNRGETDSLDRHLIRNIMLADSISRLSDGMYDITVGPLIKAWGFGGDKAVVTPNIDSILPFIGYEKIAIRDGRLVKADPRIQIDLNSIAKGYTVDLVADMLEARGIENYLVDIGGEVRCKGVNRQGNPWRIGIETPFDGNYSEGAYIQRRIALTQGALATSGNYRRFYLDAQGNKVAHTINPRTGYSALSSLLSATVVAPTCAEADALCTMLMALGAEQAIAFSKAHPEVALYLILAGEQSEEYTTYCSETMQQLIMQD